MRIAETQRLILGPPGCGKTTSCLKIVEEELAAGTPPNRIAYVSFTKRAVGEAVTRACDRFGYEPKDLPYFRTLHSLCFQLLGLKQADVMSSEHYTELGEELGYRFSRNKGSVEDGIPMGRNIGDQLLFIEQLARARRVTLEAQWQDLNDYDIDLFALKRLHRALADYKRTRGLLDFTDMLERAIIEHRRVSVDAVIIDEAQDLSNLQWEVCVTLFSKAQRVYIAGDDDQAIYRWSGADVETFQSLAGEKQVLDHSYRLPRTIHKLALGLIEQVGKRIAKDWNARNEEGEVSRLHSVDFVDFDKPGSWLVLARNGFMLDDVEGLLRKAGHLYIDRYGKSSVKLEHYTAIRAWERLRAGGTVTGASAAAIYPCLRTRRTNELDDDREYSKEELPIISDRHGIWHDALDGIALHTREYYLTAMRAGNKLHDAPRIRLSTIHGAKGGEADNVALLTDMSARSFAGMQRAPDDERRVFYVGVTRAKRSLHIISPQTLMNMGF